MAAADYSIKLVRDYFRFKSATEMMAEWRQLTAEDKEQIREGIGNESYTY